MTVHPSVQSPLPPSPSDHQPDSSHRDAKANAKAAKAYAKAQRPWYKKRASVLALLMLLVIPVTATAKTAVLYDELATTTSFDGEGCGQASGDTASVKIPNGAQVVLSNFPGGSALLDSSETGVVARIAAVKQGTNPETLERFLTWYAQGSEGGCDTLWSTTTVELRAGYTFREQVYMPRADIRYYVKRGLARKFGSAFTQADPPRMKCRRTSSFSGRCRVSWFIGDGLYFGKARVWLSVKRGVGHYGTDEVHWNYALRVRNLDDYCYSVLKKPFRRCSRLYTVR